VDDLTQKLDEQKRASQSALEQLKAMRSGATQKLRSQLDLSMIDLCKERKFKTAAKLVESSLANQPTLTQWAKTTTRRITNSRELFLAVYGSEERLRGVDISLGTVLAVNGNNVRVNVEDNHRITAIDIPISEITAGDILTMAEQVWPGAQKEYDQAALDYVLMRGSFEQAYELTKDDAEMTKATDAFVTSYLKHAVADIRNLLKIGNVKLANFRYKLLKAYVQLPAFKVVDEDFRALTKPE
jgi:hypothetical protein